MRLGLHSQPGLFRCAANIACTGLLMAGCGGGSSSGGASTPATYSIGGTITGLTTSGLVLANGNDTVSPATAVANFVFPTALASGSNYSVTVRTQPNSEVCQVVNGSGQVGSAAVTNVAVSCAPAWTWESGANTTNVTGVYGTQGVAAANNVPGNRCCSVSWTDNTGDLWLFGGGASNPAGYFNDLWRYHPASNQWTWVSGSNTDGAIGAYGTQGVGAAGNVPGARYGAVAWIDGVGNLWLFGGLGFDSAGTPSRLNDLWRYSPGSGLWTWVSGSNLIDAPGVYGTLGVAAASNVPGARQGSISWIDSAGSLWLFGGQGYDSAGQSGELNDLWRYSPSSGQWTWVAGSNSRSAPGVFGTQGVATAGNVPGARDRSASWIDGAGDFWLFGGIGYDASGISGDLNDLWRYSPASNQWTWVSGSTATVRRRVLRRPRHGRTGQCAGRALARGLLDRQRGRPVVVRWQWDSLPGLSWPSQ